MPTEHFFEESRENSAVKAAIVSKYFDAWANVIVNVAKKCRTKRLAYVDLFAGPGRYEDGQRSTPLLILEKAITKPDLRDMLVTYFNDANGAHVDSLKAAVAALPGIGTPRHPPKWRRSRRRAAVRSRRARSKVRSKRTGPRVREHGGPAERLGASPPGRSFWPPTTTAPPGGFARRRRLLCRDHAHVMIATPRFPMIASTLAR